MKKEKKYVKENNHLKEIKNIIQNDLGVEVGDISVEKIYVDGAFKEYKLVVGANNGKPFYKSKIEINSISSQHKELNKKLYDQTILNYR